MSLDSEIRCPHCGTYCLGKKIFCNPPLLDRAGSDNSNEIKNGTHLIFPGRAEGTSAKNSVQLLAEKERR